MNAINNSWVKGITGAAVASILIAGSLLIYPLTGQNLTAHVLMWALSGIVGLKISLSAFEDLDDWAGSAPMATREEAPAREIQLNVPERNQPVLAKEDRIAWTPKEPVLEPIQARGGVREMAGDMALDRSACLQFASEHPICSLATVDEDGQPHVRTVFLWRTDSSGFYFVLFSNKNVSRQVKEHPSVELCFLSDVSSLTEAKQLRVVGDMRLMKDKKLRESAASQQPLWKEMVAKDSDTNLEIFHCTIAQMTFWAMGSVVQNRQTVGQVVA